MKKIFFLIFGIASLTSLTALAQVRFPDISTNSSASNSSAFIDASSSVFNNSTTNIGKGLLFPRVDLSTFTAFSGAPIGIPSSYPTRFDGMIIYNTATSGVAGVANTAGTLSPGYWYYDNKSTTTNGGTWKPLVPPSTTSIRDVTTSGTGVFLTTDKFARVKMTVTGHNFPAVSFPAVTSADAGKQLTILNASDSGITITVLKRKIVAGTKCLCIVSPSGEWECYN